MYAIVHGVILSLCYAIIKLLGVESNLVVFFYCLLISFFLLIIFKIKTFKKILSRKILMLNGLLFGLTQILIFECLKGSGVTNVMISSLFGVLVSVLLGKFFLGERASVNEFYGTILSLTGTMLFIIFQENSWNTSLYAIIAGMSQGITFFLTRKSVIERSDGFSIIGANYLFGSIIIYMWITLSKGAETFIHLNSRFIDMFIIIIVILVAQLGLVLVMRRMSTRKSAVLTLTRLPAAVIFDYLLFSINLTHYGVISIILISLGVFLSNSDKNYIFISRKI